MTAQKRIEEQAAFWVERMNRPLLDVAEGAAFDRWMGESARHREAFAQLAATWDEASSLLASTTATPRDAEDDAASASVATRWRGAATRRRAYGAFALAACVAACVVILPPMIPREYASGTGELRTVTLADGSRMQLGGNSTVRVQYLPWARHAALTRGEAAFDIVHAPARPFAVAAGHTQVRVLGTAFHVDRLGDGAVGVQVTRGLVHIDIGGRAMPVAAGGAVRSDRAGIRQVGMELEDQSWQSGWFVARNVPLGDLIEKLRRYSPVPITVADPAVSDQLIVGRFHVARPELVVAAIRDSYGLTVRSAPDGITISQ